MVQLRNKIRTRSKDSTLSSILAKSWSQFIPNVESDGPLSYYKRSLAIPFLDDINS